MANLMLSVMGAFAEFERALIRERQREGIAIARQRGAYRGRKRSLSDEMIADLHRRVAAGERKATIARDMGISRETLYQGSGHRTGTDIRSHDCHPRRWPSLLLRWPRDQRSH